MIVRRDRCGVYRETTADSSSIHSTVDSRLSYCYRARLADLGQNTKVIERGEERTGVVEAWLLPSSNYRLSYWQGIQSFMPNVTPEC